MQEIVNSNSNSNLNLSVFKVPENCLIPTLNGFILAKDLKPNTLLPTNGLPVKVESVVLSSRLEIAYTLHYSNRSYIQTFEPNIKAVRTLQIANFSKSTN